jgi:hypothetical protein
MTRLFFELRVGGAVTSDANLTGPRGWELLA